MADSHALLSVKIFQESNKIWKICNKILEIILNVLSNETITFLLALSFTSKYSVQFAYDWLHAVFNDSKQLKRVQ